MPRNAPVDDRLAQDPRAWPRPGLAGRPAELVTAIFHGLPLIPLPAREHGRGGRHQAPPSGDDAFDAYLQAYNAHLAMTELHPCVQAAAADVHEGLDGKGPVDPRMISPRRFHFAYEYRVAVWTSNVVGRAEIERRWPVVPR